MEDYKNDIIQSRTGNVGSSDSRMIQQCAELGKIPHSAMKRMAVIKGFIGNQDITNAAMRYGDFIEQQVYNNLVATDSRWQSNPSVVSKKYSRKNVNCLTHVDFLLQDDEHKTLTIGECKCSKYSFSRVRDEYNLQLAHHYLLGQELAKELGGYKVKILLVHYDASNVDLDAPFEFDPSRLTVKQLRNMEKLSKSYRLAEGMDIIDAFLGQFDEYYEEEIDGSYLPEKVRNEFDTITTFLAEIKEREQKVDDFKKKLTDFMISKGVKSVKTDAWAITLVNESEAVSVDYKDLFVQEIEAKKPRVAYKLKEKYKKTTHKSAFVKITLKNNNNNN